MKNHNASQPSRPDDSLRGTPRRHRIIAAAVIFAGVAGASLVLAGSASAATTVIDAETNVQAATAAMTHFATATNKSFTPEADPTYHSTNWSMPVGSGVQLNNGAPGTADTDASWSFSTTANSSWTLGGEADLSAGGGIGFANVSVSVDLSASHTWGTSTTDTETISGSVPPGESEWILESTTEATYKGDYSFTAADGTVYKIENVSITTPVSTDKNPNGAVNYRVVEANISKVKNALNLPAATNLNTTKLSHTQINVVSQKLGLTK